MLLHDPPPIEKGPARTGKIIEATVSHFGFPASLLITQTSAVPPPQMLEVRNAGSGILNYRIDTDQPWLSVFPNQGSVLEETDKIEIHANSENMEVGSFSGFITIADQQPVLGLASAEEVKVPVTLIVLPRVVDRSMIEQWGWVDLGGNNWVHTSGDKGYWQGGKFYNTTQKKVFDPSTGKVTDTPRPYRSRCGEKEES